MFAFVIQLTILLLSLMGISIVIGQLISFFKTQKFK